MLRLRVIYILSLVVLVVLVIFTVFKPMTTNAEYTEVQQEQLLETEDEWIIQFDISNHEGKKQRYTIKALTGDKLYSEDVSIMENGKFTYIHRIPKEKKFDGNVAFAIHKDDAIEPFKQATYYLK